MREEGREGKGREGGYVKRLTFVVMHSVYLLIEVIRPFLFLSFHSTQKGGKKRELDSLFMRRRDLPSVDS